MACQRPFLHCRIAKYCHSDPFKSGNFDEKTEPPASFFKPICGGPSMFDLPEKERKPWRAIISKAFSADQNLSLVPGMVDKTLVYMDILRALSLKNWMFYLDPKTLRFTIDVIGRTILYVIDVHFPTAEGKKIHAWTGMRFWGLNEVTTRWPTAC